MIVREDHVTGIGQTRMRQETESWKQGLTSTLATFKGVGPQYSNSSVKLFLSEVIKFVGAKMEITMQL